ncbi:MAG TPA: hypothetical protein H9694_07195 [Firmicutes bacterium]|nr:hypothetical protein [Bacillota bacterium]
MAQGITIHDFDFGKLIAFAQSAKGDVYLKTADGDVLNLKSKLTQLLALNGTIDWGDIGEAVVICNNPEDETRLFRLNLYGSDSETEKK